MRTPAAILDIDLTQTFPDPDLRGAGAAHVLLRLHGRPLAWTTVPVHGGRLERDALIRRVLEQHAWACAVPLAERAIAGGAPPRWLDVAGLLQLPPPRPSGGPLVTVAICNTAPADVLQGALDAVQASDYPRVDVLIVDASDDPGGVTRLLEDAGSNVRYVREPERRRLSRRAMTESRGDILAITDADAAPDRRWVSALVHVFLSDPEVMAVTGPVLPLDTTASLVEVSRLNGVSRRWIRMTGDLAQLRRSGNIAWWRPALEAAAGEADRAGYTLVYEPSALVRTRAGRTPDPLPDRQPRTPARRCAIDLASPLRPIDTAAHEALALEVSWGGRSLGIAQTAGGGLISPLQVSDAIAQQLTTAVLDAGLGVGEAVCRALLTADLARFVIARHGGSLQWLHGRPADTAVA